MIALGGHKAQGSSLKTNDKNNKRGWRILVHLDPQHLHWRPQTSRGVGKYGRALASRRVDTNDGDRGEEGIVSSPRPPRLQAHSPPRLKEHPLVPEGEDEVRLEAVGLLLRRPL